MKAEYSLYLITGRGLTLARVATIPVFIALLIWTDRGGEKPWSISLLGLYFFVVLSDWLDGWLARKGGGSSRFWGLVDAGADMTFNCLSLFASAWLGFVGLWVPAGIAILGGQFMLRNFRYSAPQEDCLREDRPGKAAGVLSYALVGVIVFELVFNGFLGRWLVARLGDAVFIYVLVIFLLPRLRSLKSPVP